VDQVLDLRDLVIRRPVQRGVANSHGHPNSVHIAERERRWPGRSRALDPARTGADEQEVAKRAKLNPENSAGGRQVGRR